MFLNSIINEDIVLLVLIPPYSAYYRHGIKINGLEEKWKNIKTTISKKSVILINLEETFKYSVTENYFLDENHTTEEGGLVLTRLLKDRISLGFAN